MRDEQLLPIRDALIAKLATPKSSATKYEPALISWRNRNSAKRDANGDYLIVDEATLARAQAEVAAVVDAADERAIANLAQVLALPEFAGLSAQEIYDQRLLVDERPIVAEFPIATELEQLVTQFYSALVGKPTDLVITTDTGRVMNGGVDVQDEFNNRVKKTGKSIEELAAVRSESREIGRTPSYLSVAWMGIPYTYNTPPVEVIQRALDRSSK